MKVQAKQAFGTLPRGVMFNAYPDSIGTRLADTVSMLGRPELKGAISLFYILPTFFNSDLDRGFSLIDYNLNAELVSRKDLEELKELGILLKFDLVLNHLSVGSPQFHDLLKNGDKSEFKDFFIDWNEFWKPHGELGPDGYVIPRAEHLQKLFMRKPGLPILMVKFPDGSERPYWNTFYQQIDFHPLTQSELTSLKDFDKTQAEQVINTINAAIKNKENLASIKLNVPEETRNNILELTQKKRSYLGQMDLNAKSEKVWEFYQETFEKLKSYGATLIRLDAFAYLHKEPGMVNFFNKPETWNHLARLRQMAEKTGLALLPEIHAEYGVGLHEEVANEGFPIYDFFFPGLVIDALERGVSGPLRKWIAEIVDRKMVTINMLGCHDGIPVLDLKGRIDAKGASRQLLSEDEIDNVVNIILSRGGRVKNLYGPDGKKIAYYQVNATFFSALGENEQKFLLARALQMFMPGIPQVWYLDLFMGKNNYAAADAGGAAGHKEINRTTLNMPDIEAGLKHPVVQQQLALMRLRNNSSAFNGQIRVDSDSEQQLNITWVNGECSAKLRADLSNHTFTVEHWSGSKLLELISSAPGNVAKLI
jgi:sucrose phosphorylase